MTKQKYIYKKLFIFLHNTYCIFYIIILFKMINKNTLNKSALVSIDNTQWFENSNLNELYVNEGELAAKMTKEAVDMCKQQGMMIINVFDNHPEWHVLFSSNYKNKKPYDSISYDEVSNWNDDQIWDRAWFSLQELQDYLKEAWQETLRPDHCIENTQWAELMSPLKKTDFDYHIPKWEKVVNSWYSGFDHTELESLLKSKDIQNVILTWVATDYCVWQTAFDAMDKWYDVYVINEAVRGVAENTTNKMLELFDNRWIRCITLTELSKLLSQ